MNLAKAYKTLNLNQNADLQALKKTYRKLAFECHPDLHPNDPEAVKKFQEINQAYVTLREHLQDNGTGSASSSSRKAHKRKAESAYRRHKQARRSAASSFKTGPDRAKASAEGFSQAEKQKKEEENRGARDKGKKDQASQEEILKNILNDPFARQVFEDIFQTIKKRKKKQGVKLDPNQEGKSNSGLTSKKPRINLSQVHLFRLKAWLKNQLDHTQTLYLPAQKLLPGSEIRFQLKAFKTPARTITTQIPQDFQPGRPIRLKGLGRKLGPWQGDLYLRLLAK